MPDVINPWTNSVLYSYPYIEKEAIQAILDHFETAKLKREQVPEFERIRMLRAAADLIEANSEVLARNIVQETGKVIRDARGEINRTSTTIRASADALTAMTGQVLDSDVYGPARGRMGIVDYFPLGSILAITPYNFPLNLAAHKIGPALAMGNAVFWKPHPQCWDSTRRMAEIFMQVGFDADWLEFGVPADEHFAWLNSHPKIAVISFTGGIQTGHTVAAQAAGKRVLLELGGNDPLIVMPDTELNKVVETILTQRFLSGGQRCTASKRVYVHRSLAGQLRDALLARMSDLVVGDPNEDATDVGPLVTSFAANTVNSAVQDCVDAGATLEAGGTCNDALYMPTLLSGVGFDSPVHETEIFGPLVPLIEFDEIEEVIESVNSSQFGLQAGIFTNDIVLAKRLFRELQVGALIVNDGPGFRAEHFPFGGVKNSGVGREGIGYALREMAYFKTLVL